MIVRPSIVVAVIASLLLLGLGACGTIRKVSGTDKSPPDEFAVVTRPSLVLPPDFTLRPPAPDERIPREIAPSVETLRALFPDNPSVAPQPSPGETALLNTIGAFARADLRSTIDRTMVVVVEKGALLEDILGVGEREGTLDKSSIQRVSSSENKKD